MSERNHEYSIPSFIETGDTTPFEDGNQLDLHKASPELQPLDAIQREALNFAIETPKLPEKLFEYKPETFKDTIAVNSMKIALMRRAEVAPETVDINVDYRPIEELQNQVSYDVAA